LLLGKGQIW